MEGFTRTEAVSGAVVVLDEDVPGLTAIRHQVPPGRGDRPARAPGSAWRVGRRMGRCSDPQVPRVGANPEPSNLESRTCLQGRCTQVEEQVMTHALFPILSASPDPACTP